MPTLPPLSVVSLSGLLGSDCLGQWILANWSQTTSGIRAVHNDIFDFSFLKVLPIPGLFKAVDFNSQQPDACADVRRATTCRPPHTTVSGV